MFKSLYLSPEEYLEVLNRAYEATFSGLDGESKQHPEDLFLNFSVVMSTVNEVMHFLIEREKRDGVK